MIIRRMKIYVPKRNANGTVDLSLGVKMKRSLSTLGQARLLSEESDAGPDKDFLIDLKGEFTLEEVSEILSQFGSSVSLV